MDIFTKRGIVESAVPVSVDVVKERKGADCVVAQAAVVIEERVSSNGRVQVAGGVEQHCSSANCGIGIRVVEGQRSGANTGVVTAAGVQKERIPTNCCVSSTGGEEVQRIAS